MLKVVKLNYRASVCMGTCVMSLSSFKGSIVGFQHMKNCFASISSSSDMILIKHVKEDKNE